MDEYDEGFEYFYITSDRFVDGVEPYEKDEYLENRRKTFGNYFKTRDEAGDCLAYLKKQEQSLSKTQKDLNLIGMMKNNPSIMVIVTLKARGFGEVLNIRKKGRQYILNLLKILKKV